MKKIVNNILNFAKNNKIAVFFLVVLIIAVGIFSWKNFFGKKQIEYQTARVEKGTIVSSVSASGQMVTAGTMQVTTQASGVIKNVFVKNGDPVIAGQNIMELTLDQQGQQKYSQAWASYLSAQNSLTQAQIQTYNLQSALFSKWKTFTDIATNSTFQNSDGSPNISNRTLTQFTIAQDDWLAAEAQYKNQQNVIAQAQASLASSFNSYQTLTPIITAPISGTINDMTMVTGMTITNTVNSATNLVSSQKIATVQNDQLPIAQFTVSEIDVTKIQNGQKATLTLDALPNKTFTGKIVGIDHTGSVTSGVTTYPLTIQFDTQANGVLPNMSVNASIITQTKSDVLVVSTTAIQNSNGQSSVMVLKNGQVTQVPVETGVSSDSQTEIISGLNEGDQVVTGTVSTTQGTTTSPFGGGLRIDGVGGGGAFRGGARGD
ncbi:MAG: efflux RND transporter periplasmic adaptor subunit [Candidatus Gottesmanbacteria bacterium]